MSLFLNNGSQSNPPVVMLLTPSTMNEQLNSACKAFVDHTVKASPITTTAASVLFFVRMLLVVTLIIRGTWYLVYSSGGNLRCSALVTFFFVFCCDASHTARGCGYQGLKQHPHQG